MKFKTKNEMNLLKNSIFLLFVLVYTIGTAQNTDQVSKRGPADSYARSSISYLLLDFENEPYADYLRRAITTTSVPSKFDNNNLSKKIMKAPYFHSNTTTGKAEKIRRALIAENYAIDVVKYWWKIKDDGSYSTSLIQSRGEYNATDDAVETADASKVGRAKIGDSGLKLIGNSYVMVLDYEGIKTMQEIYDAQDAAAREAAKKNKTEFKPVKRVKNGFTGKVTSFLFKINYTDTVQGYFDYSFVDEKTIDLEKLNQIFDKVYSPFKYVTSENEPVDGTQPNPGEFLAPTVQKSKDQLMVKLVNDGIQKSIEKIEKRIEAFRVKTPVTNLDPIRAKIGTKEGLTHERRYFVWQYVENGSGNIVARKKGVIRAQKVVNNKLDELGNTRESSFYQVGGGKITEGMTLQERKDFGIGVAGGFGTFGGIIHLDLNAGQWANVPVKQLKLYGDIIFGSSAYTNAVPVTNSTMLADATYTETKFAIGILKEYPFARNFRFGWAAGYTGETVTWTDETNSDRSGEQLSAAGFNWGLKFGMNLFSPSVHLLASLNGYHYGTVTYKSGVDGEEDVELEQKMTDIFPDKASVGFDLSLRINF